MTGPLQSLYERREKKDIRTTLVTTQKLYEEKVRTEALHMITLISSGSFERDCSLSLMSKLVYLVL